MKIAPALFFFILFLSACGLSESERHAHGVIMQESLSSEYGTGISDDSLMKLLNTDEAIDAAAMRSGLVKADVAECRAKLKIYPDTTGGIAIDFYNPEENTASDFVDSLVSYVQALRTRSMKDTITRRIRLIDERIGYKKEIMDHYADTLAAQQGRFYVLDPNIARTERLLADQEKDFLELEKRKGELEKMRALAWHGILWKGRTVYFR